MRVKLKAQVVKSYLTRKGLSQNSLAKRLRISSAYMSQLLSGKRSPSLALSREIMKLFNDRLFDDLFETDE